MESSQVDQYTSAGLVSREENHIHIIEMVFRKTVNKLRNLTSRNSTASSSTANKQAGFPLVGGLGDSPTTPKIGLSLHAP